MARKKFGFKENQGPFWGAWVRLGLALVLLVALARVNKLGSTQLLL